MAKNRDQNTPPPYGVLAGLVTACFATLVGIFSGVSPFDLLVRASVSALIMSSIVSFGINVIASANIRQQSNP